MKCEKTTKKFVISPNTSGVHFSGFEHFPFDTRTEVERRLAAFLRSIKTVENPTMRIVLGDWGDGKSELFEKFLLQRQEDFDVRILYCVASAVSNAMETDYYERMTKTEVRSSVRILTALISAAFSHRYNEDYFTVRERPQDGQNADYYVRQVLPRIAGNNDGGRLVICIDEFEEFLGRETIQEVLSGLKEILNQEYDLISKGGEMAGQVHIILACTPDAFHRLPQEKESAQIFGGLERRGPRIRLQPIRKKESVRFLEDLTNHYFGGEEPEPTCFSTQGILETLHRISLGNVGNLVSLHADLLQQAANIDGIADGTMCVIDPDFFLDFLRNAEVAVYGAREACISSNNLEAAIAEMKRSDAVGADSARVFKLLLADGRPLSIEQIREVMPKLSARDVKQILNHIKLSLQRVALPAEIVAFSEVRDEHAFNDLYERLRNIFEQQERPGEDPLLKIGHSSYNKADLKEILIHRSGSNLNWNPMFPSSPSDAELVFGSMKHQENHSLDSQICRKMLQMEKHFFLSPNLRDHLFPAPVPPGLDFIVDKTKRLRVWREIQTEYTQRFRKMASLLVDLLEEAIKPEVEITKRYLNEQENAIRVRFKDEDLDLGALIVAADPEIEPTHISFIEEKYESEGSRINVAFLFSTGGISDEAMRVAEQANVFTDGFGIERLLVINLHHHVAKQIMALFDCKIGGGEDKRVKERTIKNIVRTEIEFDTVLEEWLESQSERGLVIKSPTTQHGTAKELEEAIRFFVNFPNEFLTAEEAFNRSLESYQDFVMFGKKTVFTPDISADAVARLAQDLLDNDFLEKSAGRFKPKMSAVESYLLKLIETEDGLSEKEIESLTVRRYKTEGVLKNLYLKILDYKGLIRLENKRYIVQKKSEVLDLMEERYAEFQSHVQTRQKLSVWGGIFITKQRGKRHIIFDEYAGQIASLYQDVHELVSQQAPDRIIITKAALLIQFIEYFERDLNPHYSKAVQDGEDKISEVRTQLNEMERRIHDIIGQCKALIDETSLGRIDEEDKLDEMKSSLEEIVTKPIDGFDEPNLDLFSFNSNEANDIHFNLRLFALRSLAKKVNQFSENIDRKTMKIENALSDMRATRSDILQRTRAYSLSDSASVAMKARNVLINLVSSPPPMVETGESIFSIQDLAAFIANRSNEVKTKLSTLRVLEGSIPDIVDSECRVREGMRQLVNANQKAIKLKLNHNITKVADQCLKEVNAGLVSLERSCESILQEERPNIAVRLILNSFDELERRCTATIEAIHEAWRNQREEIVQLVESLKNRYSLASDKIPELSQAERSFENIELVLEKEFADQDTSHDLVFVEKMIDSTYGKTRDILQENLGAPASRVFSVFSEKLKTTGQTAISLDDLLQSASSDLGITKEEAQAAIDTLIESGIVSMLIGYKTGS